MTANQTTNSLPAKSTGHGRRSKHAKRAAARYRQLCRTLLHCLPPARALRAWSRKLKKWRADTDRARRLKSEPEPKRPVGKHRNRRRTDAQ